MPVQTLQDGVKLASEKSGWTVDNDLQVSLQASHAVSSEKPHTTNISRYQGENILGVFWWYINFSQNIICQVCV